MKNKNAEITIEEVVKIVLAVIGIIILIILAAGLYGIFTKKTELEQARESLKQIVEKIKLLEEGEMTNFLITSPKGWIITNKCGSDNCLCSCLEKFEPINDVQQQNCVDNGVCVELDFKLNIKYSCGLVIGCFEIDIMNINLLKNNNEIFMGEEIHLSIVKNLDEILKAKDVETGKTIDELITDYLKTSEEGIKTKIETNIKENLKKYESGLNKWNLVLVNGAEPIEFGDKLTSMSWGGRDPGNYQENWDHSIETEREYNNKVYNLILKYNLNFKL